MKISDLFRMGIQNLARRKARTLLTILGMIIGTVFIIVMVSIGVGMEETYKKSVMQSGSLTKITVRTYFQNIDTEGNAAEYSEQKLNEALVKKIKEIEHVKGVTPIISKDMTMIAGKYRGYAMVYAMDCEVMEAFEFPEPIEGELPTPESRDTIVIGANALQNFYNPNDRMWTPVTVDLAKQKVFMKFEQYEVNQKKKEFTQQLTNYSMLDMTNDWQYDYYIWMDLTYYKDMYKKYANTLKLEDRKKAISALENYEEIWVNVDNIDNVLEVQEQIKALGYGSDSMMKQFEPMQKTSAMLQVVFGVIGGITMFVSAINIANTMVMSIYERTKEIGIMKVLGCQVNDVKKLFLYEAALLGLVGGVIGIILSYACSALVNKFGAPIFGQLMSTNYMYDTSVATFSVIPAYLPPMAALLTIAVGLISGYIPARRATKISAMEAMKTEN